LHPSSTTRERGEGYGYLNVAQEEIIVAAGNDRFGVKGTLLATVAARDA
jgi:hypothetical protein